MTEYTFNVNADPKMGFAFPFEKTEELNNGLCKGYLDESRMTNIQKIITKEYLK